VMSRIMTAMGLVLAISLVVTDPRHERDYRPGGTPGQPAVLRYLSTLDGFEGSPCFGLVLEAEEGFPGQVLNLTAVDPRLGSSFNRFVAAGGFTVARRWWAERGGDDFPGDLVERIQRSDLAHRVLPPVDLTLAQLEAGERFVVGAGFNYEAHREETRADVDSLLFAKMVVPTGAYSRLSLGPAIIPLADFAQLVDYEVEIAFVLLEDIRLDALPPADELARSLAYLHANDVSNRRQIILQGDQGFTLGKSAPGYLPLGPWMVHGEDLDLATGGGGSRELVLSLRVEEPDRDPITVHRQHATSREMIRGPYEILRLFEDLRSRSIRPDTGGTLRGIAREQADGGALLPRGSIVLTGTPHGTAIEAPSGMDATRLFLLGNLSRRGAKLAFAAHCVRNREAMGYLTPGDVVDAHITGLGRQRWDVRP